MPRILAVLCLCMAACLFTSFGHRPMVNGVSCGKQFASPADALLVHDITVEWSANRVVTCDGPVFWVKFDVPASHVGKKLYVSAGSLHKKAGTPNATRFQHLRVNSLLLGPGLPPLDKTDIPAHARATIPSNFTEGFYMEAPEDQSTCKHSEWLGAMSWNGQPMVQPVDGVCTFYESFTRTYQTVVLDRTPVVPNASTYYAGFFFSKFSTGKMWVAVGVVGGKEDFQTTFQIPTGECGCGQQKHLNNDFYEKMETTPVSPVPMMCQTDTTTDDYCDKGSDGYVCEDTLDQTASPIKDCKVMIQNAPCGTESWGTKVNDVCTKTCDACPPPPCEDTLAQTSSPIKECGAMLAMGGECGAEMWGTKINDVCKHTCGLCNTDSKTDMNHSKMMECKDILATLGVPITDCKVLIQMYPCGTEAMGAQINDVCMETCGMCGNNTDHEGHDNNTGMDHGEMSECSDTLAHTPSPVKDCKVMIQTAPCGTESNGFKTDDVCKKTCGLCGNKTDHEGHKENPGMDHGEMSECSDTLAHTPSPVKDCKVMIQTAPCGTEAMGTKINDVCKKTCGLCGNKMDHEGHGGHGMDHGHMDMVMGCGKVDCPSAKKFMHENEVMHKGMAVHFTCNTALDFVRGMIPHHMGAVEMCDVMLQADSMTDSGLVHFCEHVKVEQTWENEGMLDWLRSEGETLGKECGDGSMGCGNLTCKSSKAFVHANHMMHKGMSINFTCDAEVDFVQGMIPHHQGAIDMCSILNDEPGGADAYLSELCVNITRTQKQEIMYMTEWLKKKGLHRGASCDGTMYPAGEVCENMFLLSDTCHQYGGDFACSCEDLVKDHSCGSTSTVQGISFEVTPLCMRTCGACAEQAEDKTHSGHSHTHGGTPEKETHSGHSHTNGSKSGTPEPEPEPEPSTNATTAAPEPEPEPEPSTNATTAAPTPEPEPEPSTTTAAPTPAPEPEPSTNATPTSTPPSPTPAPPSPTPATKVTTLSAKFEVTDVSSVSENYLENFAATAKSEMAAKTSVSADKVQAVARPAITTAVTFTEDSITASQVVDIMASATGLDKSKVTATMKTRRRLREARRLAKAFDVHLAVASTTEAKNVAEAAGNTTHIVKAATDNSIQISEPTVTTPKLEVHVDYTITQAATDRTVSAPDATQLAQGSAIKASVTITQGASTEGGDTIDNAVDPNSAYMSSSWSMVCIFLALLAVAHS